MSDEVVIPWRWVTPLEETNGSLEALLARLEPYREAWEEFIAQSSEEERTEALQRSLRRHAIETGIIERLYDVSRGVTETLVAHGLIREVVEREEGGLDEHAYLTIKTQFEALEFLAEAARGAVIRPWASFASCTSRLRETRRRSRHTMRSGSPLSFR